MSGVKWFQVSGQMRREIELLSSEPLNWYPCDVALPIHFRPLREHRYLVQTDSHVISISCKFLNLIYVQMNSHMSISIWGRWPYFSAGLLTNLSVGFSKVWEAKEKGSSFWRVILSLEFVDAGGSSNLSSPPWRRDWHLKPETFSRLTSTTI